MFAAAITLPAAVAEIAGCFSFWFWLRAGGTVLWLVPGMVSLAVFAVLLTLVPAASAGRAYASYGGAYIVASLLWGWIVEGARPDRWDVLGGAVAVLGACVILFGPRGAAS